MRFRIHRHISHKAWFIGVRKDEHSYYLWKNGEVHTTTGHIDTLDDLLDAPGYWRTREEAEEFLSNYLKSLSDDKLAEYMVERMLS